MMRVSLRVRLAGLGMVAAALTLGGCKSDDNKDNNQASAAKVTTVNTVCPVEGGEFKQGSREVAETRTWKGKTVGFCCAHCGERFDSMSAADKDKVLSMAQSNTKPADGHH